MTALKSLVLPGDPAYSAARTTFVRGLDEVLPAAVVRCAEPADVAEAIAFARSRALPFALRGGGHSFAGHSSTRGLLIDLGDLTEIEVGADTVTIGPGVLVGGLARRLADHDRVVPTGWCPTVGVTGAVLGGGYGPLSRLFGLGADHLLAADVVLADGRTVRVDADHEPNLFWALRGAGGGNFGAVTSLVLRTRPAPALVSFWARWPYHRAAEVIEAWQHWAPDAADEINAEIVLTVPDSLDEAPTVTLFGVAAGDEALAELAGFTDRLAGSETSLTWLTGRAAACHHTYAGEPATEEPFAPPPLGERPGLRVTKSEFFDRPLPGDTIAALVAGLVHARVEGQHRELEFVPWRGAIGRIPKHASAFVHRDARFMIRHGVLTGRRATDEQRRAATRWATSSWALAHPHGTGHVYPNYPDPDLTRWRHAYYGTNLSRLREVKRAYDPTGAFRFAQSV
ncbi:FAD-binding oxidoreductase [Lentzea sp. NPDC051838]|uniref:FAD-binding oxidoreductase n=1 Tax=Lentzea sp. NPDC051838 TaxID=3154849 RepID=UPI00343E5D0A